VRVEVRVLGKGRCLEGAALLDHTPAAATAADVAVNDSSSSSSSPAVATGNLLGFVTSAVPRGAPAHLYPGGTGFCSVRGLWALRCWDVRPGDSRVLRAWLLNPGSNALRRVELRLLLER
jgi:hypothetical protein